jgi:hypothetical protein
MFKTKAQLALLLISALAICGFVAGPANAAPSGGALAPPTPVISDVICSDGCLGLRKATPGSTLQISGRKLSYVSKVSFRTGSGRILAPVSSANDSTVLVRVPQEATSGKLRARDKYGSVSGLSPRVEIVAGARQLLASSGLRVLEAEVKPRKSYFFGARNPALSFVVTSSQAQTDLRVDVVREDGQIVRSYFLNGVAAGSSRVVRWDGLDTAGKPAPGGSYRFLVRGTDGGEATLSRRARKANTSDAPADDPLSFELRPFIFPVQGRISEWGDSLGAGRGHQGQDLIAPCGRKVYAARGGKVIYKGDFSGAAGNYVVISGRATGLDFAYMHLLRPVKLKLGQTVRTGQVIGLVGATGRASTCHLHFEAWSAPGWYRGGSPVNPTGMLKKWYRQ